MNTQPGLLGKKLGMTRFFEENGACLGVTAIQLGPSVVLQVKEVTGKDHYEAIQLGFDEVKQMRRSTKAERGHAAKAKSAAMRFVHEIRLPPGEAKGYLPGQKLGADFFAAGDIVDVTAKSKGRGFAGVIKRHHFAGAPGSRGTHEYFRHAGSIGCRTYPGKVFKGHRMAGHMGDAKTTLQNIRVVAVLPDEGVVLVHGSVPGATNGYVVVRRAVKQNQNQSKKIAGT